MTAAPVISWRSVQRLKELDRFLLGGKQGENESACSKPAFKGLFEGSICLAFTKAFMALGIV